MNLQSSNREYQVGGSLPANAPTYVRRQADEDFYQQLITGEFCYVLNSRQMGKSSLRVQTMQRLQTSGIACAAIDITAIGSQQITQEQWYAGVIQRLIATLQIKVNLKSWWRERDHLSSVQRFSEFIDSVLLKEVTQKIVIFVDEIDSVLSLTFSIDDFLAVIRKCYNYRADNPEYQRLTFALIGVATPGDLISDRLRTPFNIGRAIELTGFQLSETKPLASGLTNLVENPQAVMEAVLYWTGGQPFLTQKLCQLVRQSPHEIIAGEEAESVAELVQNQVIKHWETQDVPEHLKTIRDRILLSEKRSSRLLGIYQHILQSSVLANDNPEQMELRLTGLVVKREGQLQVYNRIYQSVFDLAWVENQLGNLRPYGESFHAWKESGCQDKSRLLRGQALQVALVWAENKSLSNEDYQFLNASQQVEQREDKKALEAERQARLLEKLDTDIALEVERKAKEAVEQAHHLLAKAQQKAKQEPLNQRIWRKRQIFVSLCVASAVILVCLTGLLQSLEFAAFDQLMRLRPPQLADERILIVDIQQQDIQSIGSWPIPDRNMAELIKKISSLQPRTIGLDIYRDLPVQPGHTEWLEAAQTTPNLVGIEQLGTGKSPGVEAPPVLRQEKRVGFNNVIVDLDGRVRRNLLYWHINHKPRTSFALQLALNYLEAEDIKPQSAKNRGGYLQLGKAIFDRFESNDGGYVRTDAGGYQILANFQGPAGSFRTVSLAQMLSGEVPPEWVRDRIVLIGSTAESLKDFFLTPYSTGFSLSATQPISGVELQANFLSQILNAAEGKTVLFQFWPEWLEILWIFVWSWLGVTLIWRSPSATKFIFMLLLAIISLTFSSFLLFLAGWWIPLVPTMLALIGVTIVVLIITNYQLEKLRLRRTLELIVEVYEDNPTASYIAIEYLKRSESQENQVLINRWINKIKP